MFKYEKDLINTFIAIVIKYDSPFLPTCLAKEFYYINGRTDVIMVSKNHRLYSFEAKLTKWRDAVHQAYRNSSFSHFSYVVLPFELISQAIKSEEMFLKRRVGLCAVKEDAIEVIIQAPLNKPIQPWLTYSAKEYISKESNVK